MRNVKLSLAKAALVAAALFVASPAGATSFSLVQYISPTGGGNNHDGLAFDGTTWYESNFAGWERYDTNWNFLSTTSQPGSLRGLVYDGAANTLFQTQNLNSVVETTLAGVTVQSFATANGLNAVAWDPLDDSLWLAYFSGLIEHRTRTGTLVSNFSTSWAWTGAAFDPVNRSLLLLDNNDVVVEYSLTGSQIGASQAGLFALSNGQGLYYDASQGDLYVTAQEHRLALLEDRSRLAATSVPEPATLSLVGLGCIGALARRARRARSS
jgi:PEP-CTERM motif